MKWTYRSEYVKCGNERCKSCPHGPYWYRYAKVNGRMKKEYVGKECAFAGGPAVPENERHAWDAIHNARTATLDLACEILGISRQELHHDRTKALARRLLMESHPDRGGDNKRYCYINSAWSYIKSVHGW